jgi:hypothetical protein
VTLKILIGRFSRNFFSGTAEGIELKSGVYVPMNVDGKTFKLNLQFQLTNL